jgi:hypothetical protein
MTKSGDQFCSSNYFYISTEISSSQTWFGVGILKLQKFFDVDVLDFIMEQLALKNVHNCLNTNIFSYLETSCGQSSNLYINVVYFFNTIFNSTSVVA